MFPIETDFLKTNNSVYHKGSKAHRSLLLVFLTWSLRNLEINPTFSDILGDWERVLKCCNK